MECLGGDALWFDRCAGQALSLLQRSTLTSVPYCTWDKHVSLTSATLSVQMQVHRSTRSCRVLLAVAAAVLGQPCGGEQCPCRLVNVPISLSRLLRVLVLARACASEQQPRAGILCRRTRFQRCWSRMQSTLMVRRTVGPLKCTCSPESARLDVSHADRSAVMHELPCPRLIVSCPRTLLQGLCIRTRFHSCTCRRVCG
jgi:hypothetical protein